MHAIFWKAEVSDKGVDAINERSKKGLRAFGIHFDLSLNIFVVCLHVIHLVQLACFYFVILRLALRQFIGFGIRGLSQM